jgi:hypothetical protein
MEVTCRYDYTTRGSEREVIRTIQAHAKNDPAIAAALATWSGVLADDQPEPFHALA